MIKSLNFDRSTLDEVNMDDYLELVAEERSNIMTSLDVADALATVRCADGRWRHACEPGPEDDIEYDDYEV
jgi:hypothetical protein